MLPPESQEGGQNSQPVQNCGTVSEKQQMISQEPKQEFQPVIAQRCFLQLTVRCVDIEHLLTLLGNHMFLLLLSGQLPGSMAATVTFREAHFLHLF